MVHFKNWSLFVIVEHLKHHPIVFQFESSDVTPLVVFNEWDTGHSLHSQRTNALVHGHRVEFGFRVLHFCLQSMCPKPRHVMFPFPEFFLYPRVNIILFRFICDFQLLRKIASTPSRVVFIQPRKLVVRSPVVVVDSCIVHELVLAYEYSTD